MKSAGAGDKLCTLHALWGVMLCNSHRAVNARHAGHLHGPVSCCTCCGQSITAHLRFNWLSVRFLHIRLALLHLMSHFLFFLFIVFVYSLPPRQPAFFYFNQIIFLSFVCLLLPTYILFVSLLMLCFSSPITGTKVRETKRNK